MQDDSFFRAVDRLYPSKPSPAISPQVVAQYLKSLETGSSSSPSSSPPVPERSILEKIADATLRVRKAIAGGRLNKSAQLEWVSRLFFWLRPFYGKQSQLVQALDQWR